EAAHRLARPHVGTSAVFGDDPPFGAEKLDGQPDRVPADAVPLHERRLRRHRCTRRQLAGRDLLPQQIGQLLVRRAIAPHVDRHVNRLSRVVPVSPHPSTRRTDKVSPLPTYWYEFYAFLKPGRAQ